MTVPLVVRLLLTYPPAFGITNAIIRVTGHFNDGGGAPVVSFRLTSSTR